MRPTDEQRHVADAIRDFARRECGTRAQRLALTENGSEPHDQALYERTAQLGWVGTAISAEYGGEGGSLSDLCVVIEETVRGLLPVQYREVSLVVASAIERFGSEDQRRAVLPAIAHGAVQAIAVSEPEAGSDAAAVRCRATIGGDRVVIDGHKTWITGAHRAEHLLVLCRTATGQRPHDGLSLVHVPARAPGIETRPIATMGAGHLNDVYFDGCEVDSDAILGSPGDGWRQLVTTLNVERVLIAAHVVGLAQRALDELVGHLGRRRQFGAPLGSLQAVRHRVADHATEIEAARLLTYEAAARSHEDPRAFATIASMAKLKASEVARHVTVDAMQLMGAHGYAIDGEIEALVRRALAAPIYAGASEIQRELIARGVGL